MSLLTEQEIRSIMRSVKEIGENSDRALILATESTVIEKIKAQGPEVWMAESGSTVLNEDVEYTPNWTDYYTVPLYRLPEGD